MKKRTIKLAVYSLLMTAMLFNCKDKDKDPDAPDSGLIDDLNKVEVVPITVVAPAAVKSTEASIEASAKATEVAGALDGIAASGTVPASVSGAAGNVSGAISASEVSTLNSVSSETVSAVAAGGALSPELKTILDKAMANSAVAAYLPKFTFPTVEGVALKGTRVAGSESVEKVEGVQVNDACVDAANNAFDAVKTKLDASKATEVAKVDAAYATWIAPIAAAQTACTDGLTPKYAAYRAAAQQTAAAAIADLDAAQGVLGNLYPVLKALVNIQLLGALSSINTLEAADKQACIAKATAAKSLADAAKTANLSKVDAAYSTAIAEANKLRTDAIASCHNQGGGN
ncbi:hypothetical protein [Dyadobacter diqingensis]|uniref:hypothetical protein n=1 Tax=Dyadobacter diqingensis TaxID=2938121 RepID=UPI0020C18C7C|nr:hypothetical protein [Dyadobacter diqingensis]